MYDYEVEEYLFPILEQKPAAKMVSQWGRIKLAETTKLKNKEVYFQGCFNIHNVFVSQ